MHQGCLSLAKFGEAFSQPCSTDQALLFFIIIQQNLSPSQLSRFVKPQLLIKPVPFVKLTGTWGMDNTGWIL